MNKLLLFLFFPAFFLPVLNATDVNVADHGIVPGRDVAFEVNRLIESLAGKSDVTIVFPEGRYEFYPENAVEMYRAVTNHDNGLKRIAFPLFNFDGITIDGGGSTFVFHGRISPFVLERSRGTTLKNFSIDWDTPFHHELLVIERDEKKNAFIAEISPKKYGFEIKDGELLFNHYNWQDRIGQNITFDPNTNAPVWNTKQYSLRSKRATKATRIGENQVRLENASKTPPPVGSIVATYGSAPTNRLAQAIHIANSSDTGIENVTVYAAGGMALIAERSENVHLNGFIVTSSEGRHMATRADATHFLGCKGLIHLENCRLEHMLDDGVNVHGAYIKVEEYRGNNVFLCEISHRQQWGLTFAEPGDQVMITSRETVLPIFETTVTEVRALNEQRMLVTVSELPEAIPEGLLSMENLTWYPDVVMTKNIIRDNRARSALITTKGKVLIEDNYFSSQMHGILIEGDNNSWYESGGVEDVTITNNTFENIGYGDDTRYPLYAAPLLRPEQRLGDEKYHRNIDFTNNKIKSFNGHLVYGLSVKGLTITGNTIELSRDYPTGSTRPAIKLDHCEDVTIADNEFTGFDWPIRIETSHDTEVNILSKNDHTTDQQGMGAESVEFRCEEDWKDVSAVVRRNSSGDLRYSVSYKGAQVVEDSAMGITVDGVDLGLGVTIGDPVRSEVDQNYNTRGNHTEARNNYALWQIPVIHNATGREYSIEARIYSDGFAYRYIVPGEDTQHVDGEHSSWTIMPGAKTWYFERLNKDWKLKSYAGEWLSIEVENLHTATPSEWGPVQGAPLVFELPDELGFAAVTKAATYNYSGMRLEAVGNRTVVANFTEGDAGFDVEGPIITPWRVTMLAGDLNELVNSDLITNLNPAPDPDLFINTGYIKPGRSVWSWETRGLGDPDTQREFIDLAAEIGFEYSIVDDGWKDWDQPWETMKSLCDHGRNLGIGVWLWVDSKDIREPVNDYQQMRDYFDKVVASGSVGLKIDFMNGETKEMVDFEIAVLRQAAKRKLLINFHGCHASTGEERTWPNELTREGIRGIEVNKHKDGPLPADHNAALPFTRFIVGHADYTPILYTNPGPTTLAHQLATPVLMNSALQVYAEHPDTMMTSPIVKEALPVMQAISAVWDETIVLPGSKIGDLAAFARRTGEDWMVGILNGAGECSFELDLSFLPVGQYEAVTVRDDLDAEPVDVDEIGLNIKAEGKLKEWTTVVPFAVESQDVDSSEKLTIKLAEGGGFVAHIVKR